ncbi:MAG: hypothetical protein ACREMX_08055 [Gemmatimonadales bacterium]
MKRAHPAVPCMLAILAASCGQGRTNDRDTGAAGGTGYESGATPADTSGMTADTGMDTSAAAPSTGATSDTAAGDTTRHSDSAKANQK